jgi:hypothetical protein
MLSVASIVTFSTMSRAQGTPNSDGHASKMLSNIAAVRFQSCHAYSQFELKAAPEKRSRDGL